MTNHHYLSKGKFPFHTIFFRSWKCQGGTTTPTTQSENTRKINKRVDCATIWDTIAGFSGDLFFNSRMNLHIGPNLFTFSLKSKCLYLFVKKVELTKYLKISL